MREVNDNENDELQIINVKNEIKKKIWRQNCL